ncbi:extracellular solute-binding protein [Paenibacillus eucommiae]|uniref:Aldouronate transport system substrate-binding protein n=1 Tax=Paenibacillus eucommiae TaxID=1355755 RepID=A0ABS4IVV2_9BACL|nr:extracellular solute-binding protein [Paenibacillus eucommiae]MBP1991722.1 putative aldouronate transport system substrate-binding protein [Paenibacillus eucommiae]
MKITKKLFILTVICMLAVSAAACSSKSNPSPTKETGTTHTAEPKEEGNGTQEPVKIVAINSNASYNKGSDVEKHVHDTIQEKTGADVQVVFAPGDQYDTKLNLMLSTNEQLDIIPLITMEKAIELYKNDAIIWLDELIENSPNIKQNMNPKALEEVVYEGKIIGIPVSPSVITPNVLEVRTDWLKALGLPKPTTIEEFEAMMEAFQKEDPGKNGKNGTYALSTGWGDIDRLELAFAPFFLPQAMEWWQDDKGTLMPPELNPAYKEMMGKFVEWNKKGYIWPDMILSKADKQIEIIGQNKVGALATWYSAPIGALEVLTKTVPEAEYEPIVLNGKGINKLPTFPYAQLVTVITKKSKNPEAAMKFLDYHATKEGYDLVYLGVEGESYTRLSDGKVELIGEDKQDLSKANYNAHYWMFQMDFNDGLMFPLTSFSHLMYTKLKSQAESLPRFDAIDKGVPYDKAKWKSNAKLADLETFMKEQKMKVFSGEVQLSEWDSLMKKWLDIGGQEMIEDRNEQFKAARP